MSTDIENEYFSDGITEEIINALMRVDGLKVIARTSSFAFKGKNIDIRTIANQLDVTSVLEGSVRKFKNRVRITAQLINALDGTHFWSKNFDRELEDIFTLQDEISLLIADKIRENFGHFEIQDHLIEQPTQNIKAYELFLKGHFFQLKWDAPNIRKSIEYYEASVKHDPKFARAYYGLVQSYGLLAAWGYMDQQEGFGKAIDAFRIAKDLDSELPEYGQSFIGKSFWGEWNYQVTYDQLKETLDAHPKYTDGLEAMAELFIAHGDFDIAKTYIRRALNIDPMSANHYYTLGHINYFERNFKEALQRIEKCLTIDPNFILGHTVKAFCLAWLNRKEEFETHVQPLENRELFMLLFQVINEGKTELSAETLKSWENVAENKNQMEPIELFILANTKHQAEAMNLLAKYVAQKRGQIINFKQDPFLEKLHQLEDFHQLHVSNLKTISEDPEAPKREAQPKIANPELAKQKETLLQYIEKEKPFLNSQLSLSCLAEAIKLHPNKLSFLVNEQTGMNFNEFINQYRLEYFKKIAVNPEFNHLTILGLAYESGFNSKTVFNAYFKKAEGVTPGAWLKAARSAIN